jgi:hypothetical protein
MDQGSSCKLQAASCKLQAASCKLQAKESWIENEVSRAARQEPTSATA